MECSSSKMFYIRIDSLPKIDLTLGDGPDDHLKCSTFEMTSQRGREPID